MNKYIILLVALTACATAKTTNKSCMEELRHKTEIDKRELSQKENIEVQMGLYALCSVSDNDSEEAFKLLEKYSNEEKKK